MTESSNLQRLKAAYQAWDNTKGGNQEQWLDLFSDDVNLQSMGGENADLEFASAYKSREDAVAYFSGLLGAWDMIYWTPDVFVDDGERIAVFGKCGWTNKSTGKEVEISVAHLWRFSNDRITELVEVFDTARAAAAAAPGQ